MSDPDLRPYDVACTLGLEEVLKAELIALGARQVDTRRGGATCKGDLGFGYRACLWLRSAVRVVEQLGSFHAASAQDLYDGIAALPWERWLSPDDTLAVDATVRDSAVTHSNFAAVRVKDAVCDRFVERTGRRPSVDRESPTVWLRLRWVKGRAQIARDLSGASLHKRGYRPIQVKSPLNEATAAGLLLAAGYDGTGTLLDPMCGSATFLVEAAWIALDRAPGLDRRFAFTAWPDFDRELWRRIVDEAFGRVREDTDARFVGIDRHAGALSLARLSVDAAGVGAWVHLERGDIATWRPARAPEWVFTNPPWGERLGQDQGEDTAEASWDALAELLRACPGAQAHVLSGSPELSKRLRMKADRKWPVKTGPIDCRLLRYEVHARSAR